MSSPNDAGNVIILAAGLGSRLGDRTKDHPKCLVSVAGKPIIDWAIEAIGGDSCKNRITIVIGYRRGDVIDHFAKTWPSLDCRFVENDAFASTGTALSTLLGLEGGPVGDVLLIEGDVVFRADAVQRLEAAAAKGASAALTSAFAPGISGSAVAVGEDGLILAWRRNIDEATWRDDPSLQKTVNLTWLLEGDRDNVVAALRESVAENQAASFEGAMALMLGRREITIRAVDMLGADWFEVDDEHDLNIASKIFG